MAAPVPPAPVVDAIIALRRALLAAADALLPPNAVLWDRSMGIARTQVLGTIAELGVADLLDEGPMTAAELAARLDVDADALHRVLRAGAVDRIVKLDRRGRFRLTRVGRALRSDRPTSGAAWARVVAMPATGAAWGDLPESVRTGRSAFPRVHGASVWDWFTAHPEQEQLFAAAMRSVTELEAPGLAAASIWPEQGTVCDVAGGAGTLLAAILENAAPATGRAGGGAGVLTEAERYLAGRGLADRVELKQGDLFGELRVDAAGVRAQEHPPRLGRRGQRQGTGRGARGRWLRAPRWWSSSSCRSATARTRWRRSPTCTCSPSATTGASARATELQELLTGAGLTPGRVERVGISALVEGVAP